MRMTGLVLVVTMAALGLAACGDDDAAVVNPGPGPVLTPRTNDVRLYDAGYTTAEIHYYNGSAWTAAPVAMAKAGTWWTNRFVSTNDAEFCFRLDGAWCPGGSGLNYRLDGGTVWIKDGILFPYDPTAARPAGHLSVLTVNLHTYQETTPYERLKWVAELIAKGDVDLVAFQEDAQHKDAPVHETRHGVQIKTNNMTRLIVDELSAAHGLGYDYFWGWGHYGWTVWEEGSAVLGRSNYTFEAWEKTYVSTGTSPSSLDTRTALYGAWTIPGIGRVHLFSTHLTLDAPTLPGQIDKLKAFAVQKAAAVPVASILCGDYNMNYNSSGYARMTGDGAWTDAYKTAAPRGANDTTLGGRIDYQFVDAGASLVPVLAQRVFLHLSGPEAARKRVSDHYGVVVRYRLQ